MADQEARRLAIARAVRIVRSRRSPWTSRAEPRRTINPAGAYVIKGDSTRPPRDLTRHEETDA